MRRGRGIVWAVALGAAAAAGVLVAPSGARSTHTSRASGSDSYFSLSVTGPATVELSHTAAPPRQEFDVTMDYIGPAFQSGDAPITGTITVTLSPQEMNFGIGCCLPPASCQDSVAPQNTPGVSWNCPWSVGPGNGTHWTFPIGARPTGAAGTGDLTVSLSTGASASVTTTYLSPDATTADTTTVDTTTTEARTTSATVAVAAPTNLTETFTAATPPQSESVPIAPTADTATVGLTWPNADSSFDVTGVEIVSGGTVVARSPQAVPRRLRVTKVRTATSLKVTVRPLVKGKLVFEIVARKVHVKTKVRATVRQTRHRT
jgi:hypothetical protein